MTPAHVAQAGSVPRAVSHQATAVIMPPRSCSSVPATAKSWPISPALKRDPQRGSTVTATDELVANNQRYASAFMVPAPGRPTRGIAVVACMDARMNVYALLGL